MRKYFFFVLIIISSQFILAQDTLKSYHTIRTTHPPEIDGILDDECWKSVPAASDFVMQRPIEKGVPTQKTEFRILYDNSAVYISCMLFDSAPDSILHELGYRDGNDPYSGLNGNDFNDINADFFNILIDPYNARQDAYSFFVNAAGVQGDSRLDRKSVV